MLPSTGLFRNIPCPYFDEGECIRPFCHFRHDLKKGLIFHFINFCKPFKSLKHFPEEISRPIYHATPIVSQSEPSQEENVKKKPRLEYRPIPTFRPTATYKATVINKTVDSNSYVPDDGEAKPSSITYVPTKISTPVEVPVTTETKLEDLSRETNGSRSNENGSGSTVASEIEQNSETDKKQKVKSSERKEKDSKSSSSKRHRSSSGSKKSSRHSSKDHKSSRHDSHKDSSSSHKHKSSRHKSSSSSRDKSSSSSRHKKSSSDKNPHEKLKDKDVEKEKVEESAPDLNFEETYISSDDDDIDAQCRQIFDDYKPDETPEAPKQPKPDKAVPDEEPQVLDKKRQAHENAANVTRLSLPAKPNHSQSALLVAQRRHELALEKAMAECKAKEEEILKLKAEITEKEKEQLTPLVNPLTQFRAPKRPMITAISQRMAMEAAKRKVAELNKAKDAQFQRSTPAQTAVKATGRVAHAPSSLTADLDPCKFAPPIKEPQSTKISSNIRTQYYKIMVKNCLLIYPLPVDGKLHYNFF